MTPPDENPAPEQQQAEPAPQPLPPTSPQPAPPPQAPPPQDPPSPPGGPTPWAEDLSSLDLPEDVVPKVDSYLRDKWQPRVTALEQRAAVPEQGVELWNDLTNEDTSDEAFVSIAAELYGDDVADQLEEALLLNEEQPGVEPGQPQPGQPPSSEDERLQWVEEQREDEAYDEGVREVLQKHQGLFADEEDAAFQLAPFVDFTDGDFDAAVEQYRARQRQPVQPEQLPRPEDLEQPPPAPLVDGQQGGAPVVKDYGGDLNAAIDDFADDLRAKNAPPPVG